jgi:phosphate starvation-inducible PhoH-like protein
MSDAPSRGPGPGTPSAPVQTEVEVDDRDLLIALTGPGAGHLPTLEKTFGVSAGVRGNLVLLRGDKTAVAEAERAVLEILGALSRGKLEGREVERSMRTLKAQPETDLVALGSDVVLQTPRRAITAKTVTQQRYVAAMRQHDIVFGVGPAGTGKTYLAMAMAVRALMEKRIKRIVLTRPAVEAGERLGFLPGDLAEKVNPYLRPLYDALHDMMDVEKAEALVERKVVEVAPLAFMRGRTLNDSWVILDEAQNSTVEQMRMFLTRLGFGSKAVITGDVTQTDLPGGTKSGLIDAVQLLENVDGIAAVRFTDADVVRHPLVARIVRAYEARDRDREVERQERRARRDEERRAADAEPKGGTGEGDG